MAWTDLDDKLERGGVDASKVACTQDWEKEFVVEKVMETYGVDKDQAEVVVAFCCEEVPAPRPRQDFCKCVAERMEGES